MRKWALLCSSHLGLQLRQLGLALQELNLKLGGAARKLPLGSQELLLVSRAWQQTLHHGLGEEGLWGGRAVLR